MIHFIENKTYIFDRFVFKILQKASVKLSCKSIGNIYCFIFFTHICTLYLLIYKWYSLHAFHSTHNIVLLYNLYIAFFFSLFLFLYIMCIHEETGKLMGLSFDNMPCNLIITKKKSDFNFTKLRNWNEINFLITHKPIIYYNNNITIIACFDYISLSKVAE